MHWEDPVFFHLPIFAADAGKMEHKNLLYSRNEKVFSWADWPSLACLIYSWTLSAELEALTVFHVNVSNEGDLRPLARIKSPQEISRGYRKRKVPPGSDS